MSKCIRFFACFQKLSAVLTVSIPCISCFCTGSSLFITDFLILVSCCWDFFSIGKLGITILTIGISCISCFGASRILFISDFCMLMSSGFYLFCFCLFTYITGIGHNACFGTSGFCGDFSFIPIMSCGFYRLFLFIPTVLADRGCITVFRTSRILMVFYFIIMSCSFDIFGFCCFTYLTGICLYSGMVAGGFCRNLAIVPCMPCSCNVFGLCIVTVRFSTTIGFNTLFLTGWLLCDPSLI